MFPSVKLGLHEFYVALSPSLSVAVTAIIALSSSIPTVKDPYREFTANERAPRVGCLLYQALVSR